MKNKGLHQHRLANNPEEEVFAKLWEQENEEGKLLNYLLDPTETQARSGTDHHVSARDREVAATVIQWLGSPVGQLFLREAESRVRARFY